MAPSRDILDILPSTSEEQVLRRINELVPKKLFHPIPTFNEIKLGRFVHFDKKKNISSVEGLRQMLGSTIYNHIGDHPLREHIQTNLADYQNSFSLNRIAKKIEKILPQNYKSEPLRREQLEKVLEIMGELCIPDWAYARNGPNAVTHELASAITVRKEWEAVVTGKNHYCYFVYDAMEKYVEKRATKNHRILDVVPDYGTNINRTIALRALSRCLGSFFIRCLVYAFRCFTTTVPLDENTCLYSIDMTRLRDCAKDGSNQGKSAGQCPAQQSTSNCMPSRPGAIPSRTSSLGGEQTPPPFTRAIQRDRPSPQPGAVVNRQKAFSMDGPLPPPPPPPTGVPLRFPPSSAAPNFIPNSPTVSSPRLLQNRPGPNGLQYQSPVAGGLPPLLPSPPSGRGTVRKSPSNMDGEPPQKKKLDEAAIQRAGRQCEQAEHTTWLVEQYKAKTEEISRLNKTLQKKAGEQKDMKNQKEKADAQVKELMAKMAAMEEVQQRREATYQKQIQILEEKAQQDEEKALQDGEKAQQDKEKIQRLENVLSAAGNQADAEVIRGWEKKCNMLNKQLAQKTIEILSLGQQKEAILNDLKQLGLRYQDGPNRERQQLNKIEELKKTIEELTQNNQGGKKVEELERKIAELEYNNREQIDQYDSLEKQLQVKEKQMIQEMKATNEQRRQCIEEREEKEEMTQRLRERHRQAEKAEAELKKQIDDLTKELETTKQEKNAEKIDLDVALKQIEEEHERANQLERKEKELMARVQVLEKYLAAEKKKQTGFSECSQRVTDELEKIRKERDELKTTSGKDKEKITRMERELEEKREDLKKTETVFEELHSFCAEREQKVEELTTELEEVKKQQETKERKAAADHKKKLQETENNKKQELEAAATMLKAVEREAAVLFQKCQAAEAEKMAELKKKEDELKKMKDHLGEIKNRAEVEKNALLKKQEGELAKLNSERLEEKAELRKKLEDFKDSVRERIKTLTEKIDPLERELKEEREKNAKEQEAKASLIEEVEKLRRDLQGKEEIFLTKVQKNFEDLKKNLCKMFPSPQ